MHKSFFFFPFNNKCIRVINLIVRDSMGACVSDLQDSRMSYCGKFEDSSLSMYIDDVFIFYFFV